MLPHEPQNRDMALIRCPNCDTLHDLDGALFTNGPRKVRCASCREVWEAVDIEDPRKTSLAASAQNNFVAASETGVSASAPFDEEPVATSAELDWPENPEEPVVASQSDVDDLFAPALAPVSAPASIPMATAAIPEPDPVSIALAPLPTPDDDLEAAVQRRQEKRRKIVAPAPVRTPAKTSGSMAVVLMAAGIGTLATLAIFRHETVRIAPETAMMFDAIGLGVNTHGLDITDVQSRITHDENRETLEITGTIVNMTKKAQKIPVLRLSIRNSGGQDIYVWTASADQPEIAAGERSTFKRRLASPPADGHAVLVRFVAKDDIVAAIR